MKEKLNKILFIIEAYIYFIVVIITTLIMTVSKWTIGLLWRIINYTVEFYMFYMKFVIKAWNDLYDIIEDRLS